MPRRIILARVSPRVVMSDSMLRSSMTASDLFRTSMHFPRAVSRPHPSHAIGNFFTPYSCAHNLFEKADPDLDTARLPPEIPVDQGKTPML
jgi:hypothetical protein